MIGGPINFDWMRECLYDVDVRESHKYNYLRYRLWLKKQLDIDIFFEEDEEEDAISL